MAVDSRMRHPAGRRRQVNMRHDRIDRVDDDRREELARAFAAERPRLVSLAYRMTGSLADAEDVAQETWIRLQRAGADASTAPRDLPAWLTTTATRLALDQLRAAARGRGGR